MKFQTLGLAIFLVVALAACATVVPEPTGGSRSDGTVELSYEDSSMVETTVDMSGAQGKAKERCQAWGYEDAEAFGGQTRQCHSSGAYGCNNWTVTLTYQCTNGD